jgi:diguanylate cyclase
MGDQVLIEIASRLKANVRDEDLVARYAGDEFVILLDKVASPDALESLRLHIEGVLRAPSNVVPRGAQVTMGGSVGGARYPEDGSDPDTLLKTADRHMYARKFARTQRGE